MQGIKNIISRFEVFFMIDVKIIDLQSSTQSIMTAVKLLIQYLQEWQYKLSDNFTASVWLFLLAFFVIDVIINALFSGYEVKQ